MSSTPSRKRPWLAVVLGTLVTGLGHLYLRRWRRALGWLAVLFGTSYVFVDTATLAAIAAGSSVDPMALLPVLVVASGSVADAYLLARTHNAVAAVTVTDDGSLTHCPNCGKELDTDLEFCHWCTARVPAFDTVENED
ncbi:zinc ribbon domain-containing protein [Halapricum sp. CBA1109]|uniref:zinc ribbon domain-containing protein n=1 Tax=Halapricum sp. CBA1109 TaxID=2668068 RepID=UPI0012FBB94D|nr:zinc ribbon domain-containing protein [Halapricum sp. CBA1109]MUV89691.1 zinc ribbon domain-containing protein [Halapricum sp. CBA1109]